MDVTSELSIFVDESGDFGDFDVQSPFYLVTLVYHDQSDRLDQQIHALESSLQARSMPPDHCFHAGPIIRREEDYIHMSIDERRSLLGLLMLFARKVNISYTTLCIEKKHMADPLQLKNVLGKSLHNCIENDLQHFLRFDQVVVYYDNGQMALNKILASEFGSELSRVEFRKVLPAQYRLFQVADLFCTLELVERKAARKSMSNSEQQFFGSVRDLKKNYLKAMHRKRLATQIHMD